MNDIPWDINPNEPPSIHLTTTLALRPETKVEVHGITNAAGTDIAECVRIEGGGYSSITIFLNVGYSDAEAVAGADRLIAALTEARDRAQARIDALMAVPA